MSNPRTPGCDSEENEFAKQGGITNGAAWSVFSSIFILLFNDFFNSWSDYWCGFSGTQWVGECKTSTTLAPMTLRSPLSSVVTSIHQRRGEKKQKLLLIPDISYFWYLILYTQHLTIDTRYMQEPQNLTPDTSAWRVSGWTTRPPWWSSCGPHTEESRAW